jgi:hypothetical protein
MIEMLLFSKNILSDQKTGYNSLLFDTHARETLTNSLSAEPQRKRY